MRYIILLTLLIFLASCSEKKIVLVEINSDRSTIEHKAVEKFNFETALKSTIDSLINAGFDKSILELHVRANRKISKQEMGEIEKAIRRQGVAREYFWTD